MHGGLLRWPGCAPPTAPPRDMIATRPVPALDAQPAPTRRRPLWRLWLERLPPLFLLACAGILVELGLLIIWTLSYRLTHVNNFTYNYLVGQPDVWQKLYDLLVLANTLAPGLEPPTSLDLLVYGFVCGCVIAGLGYLGAVLLLDLGTAAVPGALVVVLGFGAVFQVTMFLLPGLFTTDVSSYVMYGHIAGIYNLNPYIYPPSYFPGNELLDPGWIHPIWWNTPSVYGPLWTCISWVMAKLITPLELTDRLFAYKLVMNAVQVINLVLLWWLLGRTLPGQRRAQLTALTVFAWNPLVLFDVPGSAHNDALMVTLLLLGLVPLVLTRQGQRSNRAWFVGVLFVGLSALIKYTTAIVGLLYVVPWARQLRGWPTRVAWIGGAGLLIGAITYALFLPWLGPEVLDTILNSASLQMYSNSVPDIGALLISNYLLDPGGWTGLPFYPGLSDTLHTGDVRFWMKTLARGGFALYLGWEAFHLWRAGDRSPHEIVMALIAASVRAFLVLNLLVFTWVLEWYYLWPLALATLLGWRRMLTRVTVALTLTALPVFYVHHYWNTNTPAALVLVYAAPAVLLPLIAWGFHYRQVPRPETRNPTPDACYPLPDVASPPTSVRSEPGLTLE
jgi:alpha-1,6-mannosyltransferase